MSRALAKASVIEHLRDGATGRASLRSLSSSPEPLIVAAAVGASMSDDAEAVETLVREAETVLASVGPWTSGNASRMLHPR